MAQKIAPWLQGLDDSWKLPKGTQLHINDISSASHDADSIKSTGTRSSRIPRRNPNGLTPPSQTSIRSKRSPLAPLSRSSTNSVHRRTSATKQPSSRSVSQTSDGTAVLCGTVQIQPRAKGDSSAKTQETLEWKKRLVQGRVGYGDQTDLFGPSGLENIFAPSSGLENGASRSKTRPGWLSKTSTTMPSSPPVFPSSVFEGQVQNQQQEDTNSASSDEFEEEVSDPDGNGSFSDPRVSGRSASAQASLRDESFEDGHEATQTGEEDGGRSQQSHGNKLDAEIEEMQHVRQINNPTELEQDDIDFSPVFLAKHTTMTGQVDYAALDSRAVKQYQSIREDPRQADHDNSELQAQTLPQPDGTGPDVSTFTDGPLSDALPANPDLSLSENLPTGTPPAASLGDFIEVKRGGYSAYGSFKDRPLSPSVSKGEDLTEHTEQPASDFTSLERRRMGQSPPTSVPAKPPITPLRPCTPDHPKVRSSGSPLKLFGAHDTFTSNRLLRRLSQLNPEETSMTQQVRRTSDGTNHLEKKSIDAQNSAIDNSFGSGELDNHPFQAEITITSASDSDHDSAGSPGSDIPVPGAKTSAGFKFNHEVVGEAIGMPRKKSSERRRSSPEPEIESKQDEDYTERIGSRETSKRPPTSPVKHPTPKRRRTLHASELDVTPALGSSPSQHSLDSARARTSSRKRKDAKQGEQHNIADAATLAKRKLLRPRNPTPSQDRRQEVEAEVREAAEEYAAAQDRHKLEAVIEQIESSCVSDAQPTLQEQAEAVATEVAAFTLKVSRPSAEHADGGVRKRSVTTQDFLNEAMMVMNLIRAKARRPQSGLGSVEESDAEGFNHSNQAEDSGESLRVSRPPSREGGPSGWRTNVRPQTDARIVSHLRKFQEKDDTDFIADSVVSLDFEEESVNENVVAIDEHANIRISGPISSNTDLPDEDDSRPYSQRSNGSTLHTETTSTGRTMGTSSTKHSENVGTLAPDAVTHLIGEQVGTMTFDKEKKCWVRVRSSENRRPRVSGMLELPSHVSSDDDPFREISDLPVDEQLESRRVSANTKSAAEAQSGARPISANDQQLPQNFAQQATVESRTSSEETVKSRPVTRDNNTVLQCQLSSVPSRYAATLSSHVENIETRATSWSDEELVNLAKRSRPQEHPLAYAAAQAALSLRGNPVALIEDSTVELLDESTFDDVDGRQAGQITSHELGDTSETNNTIEEITSRKTLDRPTRPGAYQSVSRPVLARPTSLRKQALQNYLATDPREESEISMTAALPGQRVLSVSLSVSRPVASRHSQYPLYNLQSSPCRGDSTLMLSDLPEFTIHENDAQGPSERMLARRLAKHAFMDVNDRFTLATKDLVKTLTDVEEHELYWEDVKKLDLTQRSLSSLHGLEQFCERLQDLNVSKNALTHLDGAPSTVRSLAAMNNQLSSLTGWSHLYNLQYLNISGNALDSVMGLSQLVHLRELVADDNIITSLDGLLELDGLLKIRMRRNKLQHVSFENAHLHRLTDLDLGENQIVAAAHFETLSSLKSLKLDRNVFRDGLHMHNALPHLEHLSVKGCAMTTLNVSQSPRLRFLMADDNSLTHIEGLSDLKHLETLSMCRQVLPEGSCISILEQQLEAHTIKLSGNMIPTLNVDQCHPNLRHLDLASVGLREISDDFGLRFPNLRTLNLNFNALKDIRPLLNIRGLKDLSVCGNRLHRLRTTVATLAMLTTLVSVDLRDNPVTQGFYAPPSTAQTSIVQTGSLEHGADEDELAAAMEMARYTLPRATAEQDTHHRARMDEGTKLRRRVYELMLANSCPRLADVDGLLFDKRSAAVKDKTFYRLVELKIVKRSTKGEVKGAVEIETGV